MRPINITLLATILATVGCVYGADETLRHTMIIAKQGDMQALQSTNVVSHRETKFSSGDIITGKVYVTDGDEIQVSRHHIRIAGVDTPEWDQLAQDQASRWFKHGEHVRSVLIQTLKGQQVHVTVEGYDKYDRVLGIVSYRGKDVGAWLVQNGYAIAAYSDKYKHLEREAKKSKRGMWGYVKAYDPRGWWRGEKKNIYG